MLKTNSKSKIRRLNLRQRKKHHVGEYLEYVVYYKIVFSKEWKYEDISPLVDKFFDECEKYGFQPMWSYQGEASRVNKVSFSGLSSKILLSNSLELGYIITDFDPGAHVVTILGPDAWYGDFDNFDEEAEFKSRFALTIRPRK